MPGKVWAACIFFVSVHASSVILYNYYIEDNDRRCAFEPISEKVAKLNVHEILANFLYIEITLLFLKGVLCPEKKLCIYLFIGITVCIN